MNIAAFILAALVCIAIAVGIWWFIRRGTSAVAVDTSADDAKIDEQAAAEAKAIDDKAAAARAKIPQESDDALLADVNSHRPGGN